MRGGGVSETRQEQDAIDVARKAMESGNDMIEELSKLGREVRDPSVSVATSLITLQIVLDGAALGACMAEISKLRKELDFRRELDDFGKADE